MGGAERFELYRRPNVITIICMRRKIRNETWEQIKTGYAAGVGLREIARKMNIPEGTVLAHAKRHGWTQQIQVATRELSVMQSDAITPVQPVPQSIAAILSERPQTRRPYWQQSGDPRQGQTRSPGCAMRYDPPQYTRCRQRCFLARGHRRPC